MFEVGKGRHLVGSGWALGCDPEIFISRQDNKGKWSIIGSERILGLAAQKESVATDGIQIELHPIAETCRANVSNSLKDLFQNLKVRMEGFETRNKATLKVDFSALVKVSRKELMDLSEQSRELGCTPSMNAYGRKGLKVKGVTILRSAAGHIHFGSVMGYPKKTQKITDPNEFAKLCDILIGIPGVLIDRDPSSARRRKRYGKAGEYRMPDHGFEYRTLSNFWLRSYQVMSLMFGLAKFASAVYNTAMPGVAERYSSLSGTTITYAGDLKDRLLKEVPWEKVETAINTNDQILAQELFDDYCRPVFSQVSYADTGITPYIITSGLWDYFVSKPLDHWFPQDPLTHWCNKPEGHGTGWESWATNTLLTAKSDEERAKKTKASTK